MTRIKICGITNRDDAEAAAAYGADALGFIGVPTSPRYVDEVRFDEIAIPAPLFVKRVVVVQRADDALPYSADYIQYYDESTDRTRQTRNHAWQIKCIRMKDETSLDEIRQFPTPVAAFLLDTYHKDKLGGSGETFNWELAAETKRIAGRPIILAGGQNACRIPRSIQFDANCLCLEYQASKWSRICRPPNTMSRSTASAASSGDLLFSALMMTRCSCCF